MFFQKKGNKSEEILGRVVESKERRIIIEAIYDFFGDDTVKDEDINIAKIYQRKDEFMALVTVAPYKFTFIVTGNHALNESDVNVYKRVGGLK